MPVASKMQSTGFGRDALGDVLDLASSIRMLEGKVLRFAVTMVPPVTIFLMRSSVPRRIAGLVPGQLAPW